MEVVSISQFWPSLIVAASSANPSLSKNNWFLSGCLRSCQQKCFFEISVALLSNWVLVQSEVCLTIRFCSVIVVLANMRGCVKQAGIVARSITNVAITSKYA